MLLRHLCYRVQQTGTDAGQFNQSRYRTVKPGDEVSFLYDEHDKIRHKVCRKYQVSPTLYDSHSKRKCIQNS